MISELNPIHGNKLDFSFFSYLEKKGYIDDKTGIREFVVQKNEYIYQASIKHNFMYEVVQGAVKLGSYKGTGDEFIYDVLYRGDFFGNLQYLDENFDEFSRALVDSKIRIYNISFFKKVVLQEPKITEWYISYLVKRWFNAENKLKKIHEKESIEKILFLKSIFSITIMDIHHQKYTIYDLLSQKDLGDLIGATRQTIASALKQM